MQLVPVADISDVGQVRYLEYPVLTGVFQWGVGWANRRYLTFARSTGVVPVPLDVGAYFTIGAMFLGLLYLWAVASTAKIARRRIWDTAIMCLSPLLIVHAFTNWDAVAIALCAAGMLAWARRHPTLAGVLLGLGMAAKLYPILLLGPLLVLCLRTGKISPWVKAAIGAAVAWAVVNVPVMLMWPQAWYEFIRLNSERGPEWDTWYFIYARLSGSTVWDNAPGARSPDFLNNLSLALFAVACLAIGWFALSVRRRPRFASLAFLVVAAFLLTNKVWSPAILAVAATAGGAGPATLAAAAALAVQRGGDLDPAHVPVRRRAEQGTVGLPVHLRGPGAGRHGDHPGRHDHPRSHAPGAGPVSGSPVTMIRPAASSRTCPTAGPSRRYRPSCGGLRDPDGTVAELREQPPPAPADTDLEPVSSPS